MKLLLHAIRIIALSLFSTATLFPISALDTFVIAALWLPWTPIIVIAAEILSAFLVHTFAEKLVGWFVKSKKNKKKLAKVSERLQSKGRWMMILFAATPLPYSLAIYTYAGAQVPFKKILVPLLIGRIIKYTIIIAATVFGFNLFGI